MLNHIKPTVRFLQCIPSRLLAKLGVDDQNLPPVNFVVENANWSIRWDGIYITEGVNAIQPKTAGITDAPHRLVNRVVHFGSQYMWTSWGPYMSPSNRYAVTYFHGKPEDGTAAARNLEQILVSLPKLDYVITAAKLMEERLLQWGVPRDKLVRIPIGVDTKLFQPPSPQMRDAMRKKLAIPDGHFCIGSFQKDGQGWGDGLTPKLIKGPDVFLEAVKRIHQERPVHILLTGPARGYVKQGLDAIGVSYTHTFLDDFKELAQYYHALDVYLVTSREEGGPKAITEAMASSVPILTTCVGMAPDLVKDGINGGLVEVEDANGLAERALRIATDSDYANTLVQGGKVTVAQYDWSNVARQHWDQVYSPMLRRLNGQG